MGDKRHGTGGNFRAPLGHWIVSSLEPEPVSVCVVQRIALVTSGFQFFSPLAAVFTDEIGWFQYAFSKRRQSWKESHFPFFSIITTKKLIRSSMIWKRKFISVPMQLDFCKFLSQFYMQRNVAQQNGLGQGPRPIKVRSGRWPTFAGIDKLLVMPR